MGSSYGTIRSTFDFNRPIFKNVLSFRVLGAITNEHFTRKPSYDKTRRTTFSTTFRPHKNTTIRASWEKIDEKYDRPNSYTPRDQVTAWKNAGSPSWDPTSNTYYYYNADGSVNKTGTVGLSYNSSSDPYATAMTGVAAPANGQVWVSTIGSLRVRPTLGISSGQESYFYPTYWGVNNISTTSTSQIGTNARELTGVRFASYFNVPAAYQSATALGYPSFGSTSDRNFYDKFLR